MTPTAFFCVSVAAEGVLHRIARAATHGRLVLPNGSPYSDAHVARLCGVTARAAEKLIAELDGAGLIVIGGAGVISIADAAESPQVSDMTDDEIDAESARREQRRAAGKASAEAKRQRKANEISTEVQRDFNETSTNGQRDFNEIQRPVDSVGNETPTRFNDPLPPVEISLNLVEPVVEPLAGACVDSGGRVPPRDVLSSSSRNNKEEELRTPPPPEGGDFPGGDSDPVSPPEILRPAREPASFDAQDVPASQADTSPALTLAAGPGPSGGLPPVPPPKPKFNPLAGPFPHGDDFADAWASWVRHRREKRQPLTPTSARRQLDMLGGMSEADAVESLASSTRNGWQGLFPPKPLPNYSGGGGRNGGPIDRGKAADDAALDQLWELMQPGAT